ncbi:VWA domain-containing protein [Geitlerinema sp. P-1104]|uniref:VWA domain-containing protein n=1 Tax=Geitlerinema sp. P-1104 TaxID=2546230 RepID=UPI0014777975|nr:VWA domain-containing protein [Geitlerinema sp. P-1104]NMG59092.1 VWA domain-containing protein [Geitlerinema sp. P-1104]
MTDNRNLSSNVQASRRWRLILGTDATGVNSAEDGLDQRRVRSLEALYRPSPAGGLGRSTLSLVRWLDEIRCQFPESVVRVMQHDAIERLNLRSLLLEPELSDRLEPDPMLAAEVLTLMSTLPDSKAERVREIVRQVVEELEQRLRPATQQALSGRLRQRSPGLHPRYRDIDWQRTLYANLKHYQPHYGTIIPERLIHRGTPPRLLSDVVLCLDQSASMAASVVYASVFASVLASVSLLNVRLFAFDTSVLDLTPHVQDPVNLLLGMQLGGGTDIAAALRYSLQEIQQPHETILILLSDLYDGGDRQQVWRLLGQLLASGVRVISLLALDETGIPRYDVANAEYLAGLGIPSFACHPDEFSGLISEYLLI